ncbi:protein of unknown function (plasmid) [Azospirillum baldaniorum]|uniref:Uncharacterized protein n=1 Tax=Azospirillum baldaniorum TaxID=1064539 RepID=A0A9P1JW90_9PROT|nr:protein of unknown function [Azospirillum baldaniorum]
MLRLAALAVAKAAKVTSPTAMRLWLKRDGMNGVPQADGRWRGAGDY